jgi:soluble lytic murein transglycosylase-like protein
MFNFARLIHPHARLWIVTTILFGLLFVLKTPIKEVIIPPHGKVIAYYQNDYQRFAIEELAKRDNIEQYPCLYELWTRESNWRPKAKNKESSAMGIPQLLSSTWKNIGLKPTWDGYKQVSAGLDYIDRRYGKKGVCRAYAHHLAKRWY